MWKRYTATLLVLAIAVLTGGLSLGQAAPKALSKLGNGIDGVSMGAVETSVREISSPLPVTQPQPSHQQLIVSNKHFVYGPEAEKIDFVQYIAKDYPQLMPVSEVILGRCGYYSINPAIILTLTENTNLPIGKAAQRLNQSKSAPEDVELFTLELDQLMDDLFHSYYSYRDVETRGAELKNLESIETSDKRAIKADAVSNAGSYALLKALSKGVKWEDIAKEAQRYASFPTTTNGGSTKESFSLLTARSASSDKKPLLQLPFPVGQSWYFGGVHGNNGGWDMSSIDFAPSAPFPGWGSNTANMMAVTAADGVVTSKSNCRVRIQHKDEKGRLTSWSTQYYHLEGVSVNVNDAVGKNQKIGILANTLGEAICDGGDSSAIHLHFALLKDGEFVGIQGTALSGWTVRQGNIPYDHQNSYMHQGKSRVYAFGHSPKQSVRSTNTTCTFPAPLNYAASWDNINNWPDAWTITESCVIANTFVASGDVKNITIHDHNLSDDYATLLTVMHDGKDNCTDCGDLDMDLNGRNLLIKNGAGVLIKEHARIH